RGGRGRSPHPACPARPSPPPPAPSPPVPAEPVARFDREPNDGGGDPKQPPEGKGVRQAGTGHRTPPTSRLFKKFGSSTGWVAIGEETSFSKEARRDSSVSQTRGLTWYSEGERAGAIF